MKKIGWMTVREAVDQLKNGFETEHFKARVSWPLGFDCNYKLEITMKSPASMLNDYNYGFKASALLYESLESELDDLRHMADNLIFSIGCYEMRRNQNIRRHHKEDKQ